MPNRIIKESIRSSGTIDQLSPEEEVFFYRLITMADDFGLYDARPSILLAYGFPLKVGKVTIKDVEKWLTKLAKVGLVQLYEVKSQPYLKLTTWTEHQTIRAQKAKFPEPPDDEQLDVSNCIQLQADASNGGEMQAMAHVIQSNPIQSNPIRVLSDDNTSESVAKEKPEYSTDFEEFWAIYPRRVNKAGAFKVWAARLKEGEKTSDLCAAAHSYAEVCAKRHTEVQYIKHPSTFLGKDKPYLDYLTGPPEERNVSKPVVVNKGKTAFDEDFERRVREGRI